MRPQRCQQSPDGRAYGTGTDLKIIAAQPLRNGAHGIHRLRSGQRTGRMARIEMPDNLGRGYAFTRPGQQHALFRQSICIDFQHFTNPAGP